MRMTIPYQLTYNCFGLSRQASQAYAVTRFEDINIICWRLNPYYHNIIVVDKEYIL